MTNSQKKIIFIVIFIQLLFIGFILVSINKKNQKINISPIDKNSINQIPTKELKYFYEISIGKTEISSPKWLKKNVVYTHNLDGLNETKEYSIKKDPYVYRIITLGDSYTYGSIINTQNNWTELLENKLNERKICKNIDKFEVINLGVHGYDIEYEVERYKKRGQKYNPDMVIWMLMQADRINEHQIPLIKKCMNDNEWDDLDKTHKCYNAEGMILSESENILYQSKAISKIENYFTNKIIFIDFFSRHEKIISESKVKNFTSLNFNEEFDAAHKKFGLRFPDGHPNERGSKKISEIIYKELFETNQIPCDPM